jgi:L-seryl-tRNA(Ser) seleniumtransferase
VTVALALRGRPVVNARGYSTKVGGCRLAPEVLAAMAEAAGYFARMEDLQAAAGAVIAQVTGAEAGYVTSGATAGLTLATAAAIAGMDVGRMNRLPDTTGMPNEVVCLRRHRNDYDHALRAAGARIIDVGFNSWTFAYEVEEAITPATCAVFYLASDPDPSVTLDEMVRVAHAHGLPVIVDASLALPPASNLGAFVAAGADLVAFSGGKHVEGPQATGILCGRRDLIRSVALQHQDMDVYPASWPGRALIADGTLSGPPHHGIGRGFKVGKEEIAGLVAALQAYVERDFAAERRRWDERLEAVAEAVDGVPGIRAELIEPREGERPVPQLHLHVDQRRAGLDADSLINELQAGDPLICTYEPLAASGTVVVLPESLLEDDAIAIGRRIREIVNAAGAN